MRFLFIYFLIFSDYCASEKGLTFW